MRKPPNMQTGDRHWGTVRVMTDKEMVEAMCENGKPDNGWLLGVSYTLGAFALGVWVILLEIY